MQALDRSPLDLIDKKKLSNDLKYITNDRSKRKFIKVFAERVRELEALTRTSSESRRSSKAESIRSNDRIDQSKRLPILNSSGNQTQHQRERKRSVNQPGLPIIPGTTLVAINELEPLVDVPDEVIIPAKPDIPPPTDALGRRRSRPSFALNVAMMNQGVSGIISAFGNRRVSNTGPSLSYSEPLVRKFKKYARAVVIGMHFVKYLARVLKNPIEWGWEYDPTVYIQFDFGTKGQSAQLPRYSSVGSRNGGRRMSEASGTRKESLNGLRSSMLSKKSAEYNGYLPPEIRDLLRKKPSERDDAETNVLQDFCSSMKAFRRFTSAFQRAILKVARYERWQLGRVILKEGHLPFCFYVILDGEVEIYCQNKAELEVAMQEFKDLPPAELKEKRKKLENAYIKMLGTSGAGQSFGDVAFRDNLRRTASIKTRRATEFLVVEKADFLWLMDTVMKNTGSVDAQKRLEAFADTCPLFTSLEIEKRSLSRYCDVRSVGPNITLICEGETTEFVYFIMEGYCQVMKIVSVVEEYLSTGRKAFHPLPLDYQNDHRSRMDEKDIQALVEKKIIKPREASSRLRLTHSVVKMKQIGPGDYFGESNGFIVSPDERPDRLEAMNKSVHEIEYFQRVRDPISVSIVTESKVEIVGMSKVDLHRFSTHKTWKIIDDIRSTRKNLAQISNDFIRTRDWEMHCREYTDKMMDELKEAKDVARRQFYERNQARMAKNQWIL